MASYYFNVFDRDGFNPADHAYDFLDLNAAMAQAEVVLAEMALDGLPTRREKCLEVEILNEKHVPLARMTLEIKRQYFADTMQNSSGLPEA